MIGATIIDGFISTDVAAAFATASPDGVKRGYHLIVFLGVALTDLAKLGWVSQALASAVVLLGQSAMARVVGLIGLLSGVLVVGAVASSGTNMTMTAILSILLAQATWNLAAAGLLMRGSRASDSATTVSTVGSGALQVN
jgi:hypothetical protein